MHGGRSIVYSAFVIFWSYKHNGVCFSVRRRFISNKEKRRRFLFPYSKYMEVDQGYITRLSSFGLISIMLYVFLSIAVSYRIRKKETFPFSLF